MFQTPKSSTKPSLLPTDDNDDSQSKRPAKKANKPLVDDDDDFLSKRPAKQTAKPLVPEDDADFLSKRPAKKTTKPLVVDDDDFLSKRPPTKSTKSDADGNNASADVKSKDQSANKAKKEWPTLDKPKATDDLGSYTFFLFFPLNISSIFR